MGILHLDIHLRISGLVKKKKQVEPTKGRLEQRTRETELSGGILPASFTSGARRWRRGPSAARVSTRVSRRPPGVPAKVRGSFPPRRGWSADWKNSQLWRKKDSDSQPPAPRGAGAGGACARPGPQFPQRRREAPGGPEAASRGGTRALAGARRRHGRAGLRRRPSRAWRAPRQGPLCLQAPEGTAGSALGRARRPQSPTSGEGCVSFAPAGGQDVGAGQRLGGGGGVGDGEPVAAAGAPASGELAESATFCATFAKRKIKFLQVVAELQVASGPTSKGEGTVQPSWDRRRPSSAEWCRRGRPAEARAEDERGWGCRGRSWGARCGL